MFRNPDSRALRDESSLILDKIVAHKRGELEERKRNASFLELELLAGEQDPPRPFRAALQGDDIALIAEVKKASPSKGLLAADFDPIRLAMEYQHGGASAISVLTDEEFFQGSLDHLRRVKHNTSLPVLRKDFVIDPYQVVEARAAGADCILLIVSILGDGPLRSLSDLAMTTGMGALVEVHDATEVHRALDAGAELIGINNRDLRSFDVDLQTTERLCQLIPSDCTVVSESGIHGQSDVARLREWGVDAMLVGESLVVAEDTGAKVQELVGS